jgi:polysaccharide biosynthesis/export protein
VSIFEVIGMAGDITIYGKKDNVLVIREHNGKREFGRLDLRRSDIFQSPYFYLQQNDMVIIEPNSKKPTATEQDNLRKLTMVTSFATLVSTFAILVTLFK